MGRRLFPLMAVVFMSLLVGSVIVAKEQGWILFGYKDNPPPLSGWTHDPLGAGTDDSLQRHGIQLEGGDVVRSSPTIADIDGNPANGYEVAVGGSDGKLYVYRSDGSRLWAANTPPFNCDGGKYKLNSAPAVGDLYGDGTPYVVITYGTMYPSVCDGGVIVYNGQNGQEKWRFSLRTWQKKEGYPAEAMYGTVSSPAIADTDGDGKMEIGFGGLDRNVYLLNHDASVRWYYHAADTSWSTPAFYDINGDSQLEMIIGTDISKNPRMMPPVSDGGFVYAFKTTAQSPTRIKFRDPDNRITLWKFESDQVIYSSPAIGDVWPDNPGEEIVVGSGCHFPTDGSLKTGRWVKILRPSDGTVLQTLSSPFCVSSSPSLGDIDDDGKLEIVVTVSGDTKSVGAGGDGLGRVIAWDAENPKNKWEKAPTTPNNSPNNNDGAGGDLQSPIIADVDGNGSLEVIVANLWSVIIFNGKDGTPLTCQNPSCGEQASLFAWKTLKSTPAVGDIDRDGDLDIVIGGGHIYKQTNGFLYSWTNLKDYINSPAGTQPAYSAPWPMFRGNAENTGIGVDAGASQPPTPIATATNTPLPTNTPTPLPTTKPEEPTRTSTPTPSPTATPEPIPMPGNPRNQPNALSGWTHSPHYPDDTDQGHGVAVSGADITRSSVVIAEIDNNTANGKEVAVGSYDGTLHVYRSNGQLLWTKNVLTDPECSASPSPHRLLSSPSVGELYGDGTAYVVIGYGGLNSCDGGVVAYNGATGDLKWRLSLQEWGSQHGNTATIFGVLSTPALADTDGDGQMEIGFAAWDNYIYLLNADGTVRWYYEAKNQPWSSPAFTNIDADSNLEMIIGSGIYIPDESIKGGYVYAFDTTTTQPGTPVEIPFGTGYIWRTHFEQAIFSSPVIGDVLPTNDGPEVVIGSGCSFDTEGELIGVDKVGKWVKILRPSDGQVLKTLDAPACVQSSVALGDLDEDSTLEVIATVNGAKEFGGDGYSRIVVWKPTVSTTPDWWDIPTDPNSNANDPYGGDIQSPIVADLDGNGSLEVIAANFWSVTILEGKTGNELTCQDLMCGSKKSLFAWKTVKSTPAVGDINGDGKLDLVIGGGNLQRDHGMIYAWTDFADAFKSSPGKHDPYSVPMAMFRGNAARSAPEVPLPTFTTRIYLPVVKNHPWYPAP
jgi:hypothetical protein